MVLDNDCKDRMHSFVVLDLEWIGGLVDLVVLDSKQLEHQMLVVLQSSDLPFGVTRPSYGSNLGERHVHKSWHTWGIDNQ